MAEAQRADPEPGEVERKIGRWAITWGFLAFGLCLLLWLAAFLITWPRAGGDALLALRYTGRFAVLGGVVALASPLFPLIARAVPGRLRSWATVRHAGLISVGLVLGMTAAGLLVSRPDGLSRKVSFSGPTLDGGRFELADHLGKVVLLDFWATWCGPCIAQLPTLQRLQDRYRDQGLRVVGVSLDLERAKLEAFLEARPQSNRPEVFFGEGDDLGIHQPAVADLGVRALPQYLLIDREGRLAERVGTAWRAEIAVARALGRPVGPGDRLKEGVAEFALWLQSGIRWTHGGLLLLWSCAGVTLLALLRQFASRLRL